MQGQGERVAGPRNDSHERLFDALYRSHAQGLRRYVTRILKSPADADEIAHDAFVRLYRSDLTQYHDPRAVLFRTGWRLALNRIRSRGSNPLDRSDGLPLEADRFVSEAESAEESLLSRERENAYHDAVAALPPRCREVIELRVVQELSYKEMSRQLGLSVSTIEKHIVKGKKTCVDALAAWRSDPQPVAA